MAHVKLSQFIPFILSLVQELIQKEYYGLNSLKLTIQQVLNAIIDCWVFITEPFRLDFMTANLATF